VNFSFRAFRDAVDNGKAMVKTLIIIFQYDVRVTRANSLSPSLSLALSLCASLSCGARTRVRERARSVSASLRGASCLGCLLSPSHLSHPIPLPLPLLLPLTVSLSVSRALALGAARAFSYLLVPSPLVPDAPSCSTLPGSRRRPTTAAAAADVPQCAFDTRNRLVVLGKQ